jgi:hypothetical protein
MRSSALLALLASVAGCALGDGQDTQPVGGSPAALYALSTYEATLGTMVEVYGAAFPDPSVGRLSMRFRGSFIDDTGATTPVEFEHDLQVVDAGTARWTSFGPYTIPFDPSGRRIGRFEGNASLSIQTRDGERVEAGESLPLTFRVLPSIVVHELQPTSASCAAPASRGLGGVMYRLRVEAVGFEPQTFTYTLAAPAIGMEPVAVRHIARGPIDELGESGDFQLPYVPDDVPEYGAILNVEAIANDGRAFYTSFAIGVHKPLEVFYNGNVQVAEVFEPTPVSGCIPGGEAGRQVSYTETMSETRSRSYNMHWDENWLRQHTVSSATSTTIGLGISNGVGFATTDGTTFTWSVNGRVEAGIPIIDALKAEISGGVSNASMQSNTSSVDRREDVNASETTTDTTAVTEGTGGSVGEGFTWDVSSFDSISRQFGGNVIAHTHGVFYRQTSRLIRRASIVTYNQCGAAQVVGEIEFTDWTWAPDLALGQSCPPLPRSNFGAAECYVSPCAGE